jgi:PD-(D/E)XK nuclease superfamily
MATVAVQRLTAQQVSHAVITAAMKVHSELGAGLLESAYGACLQGTSFEARGTTRPHRLGSRLFIGESNSNSGIA